MHALTILTIFSILVSAQAAGPIECQNNGTCTDPNYLCFGQTVVNCTYENNLMACNCIGKVPFTAYCCSTLLTTTNTWSWAQCGAPWMPPGLFQTKKKKTLIDVFARY